MSTALALCGILHFTPAAVADQAVKAQERCERTASEYDKLQQRVQDEAALSNQRLVLPKLSVWDGEKSDWRTPLSGEVEALRQSKVRVIHLWAPWCKPCVREFPLLRDISRSMLAAYNRPQQAQISYTYVSVDTDDPAAMVRFLKDNQESMPIGLQFGDYDKDLGRSLLQLIPQKAQSGAPSDKTKTLGRLLPLPMTLVLDEENVVRLAVVGSLETRRAEFVNGVERLRKLAQEGANSGSGSVRNARSRHASGSGN